MNIEFGVELIYEFNVDIGSEMKWKTQWIHTGTVSEYIIMINDMKINGLLKDLLEYDFDYLMSELKMMSKNERRILYQIHTKRLFLNGKNIVSLDDLFNESKVPFKKFKKCFLFVGTYLLSSYHLGEYNQEYFKDKTGVKRSIYFQKVVLVLSLMGYIKGKKMNFSNHETGGHCTIYEVNTDKLYGFDMDLLDYKDLDNVKDWSKTEFTLEDWLVSKQHKTMMSMGVDDCVVESCHRIREFYKNKSMVDFESGERDLRHKQLCNSDNILSLKNKDFNTITRFSVDDKGERLYSLMTSINGFFRLNRLTIDGMKNVEVDVTSAQPTFLGIILKQRYPEMKSQWLDHCLSGDFYEWVMEITGMIGFNKSYLKEEIEKSNVYQKEDKEKMLSKIDHPDIYKSYRPIVKKWMMIYLFDCNRLNPECKKIKSCHKRFVTKLSKYLKENEPEMFEYINHYKTHPRIVMDRGRKKKKSDLPIQLQHQEVVYIKECLKNLKNETPYIYTVHDCVGCRDCDGSKVKSIMEKTSLDMFGVKVNLKIEGGEIPKTRENCMKNCPFYTQCNKWETP